MLAVKPVGVEQPAGVGQRVPTNGTKFAVKYARDKLGLHKTVVIARNVEDTVKQTPPAAAVKTEERVKQAPPASAAKNSSSQSAGIGAIALSSLSRNLSDFAASARSYVRTETNRAEESVRETAANELSYVSRMMQLHWPSKDPEFPTTKALLLIKESGKTDVVRLSKRDNELFLFGDKRVVIPHSDLAKKFESLYGAAYEEEIFNQLKYLGLVRDYALKGEKGKAGAPMVGLTPLGASLAERFQQIAHDLELIRQLSDPVEVFQTK
jgi:hypothetical protein